MTRPDGRLNASGEDILARIPQVADGFVFIQARILCYITAG